MYRESIYVGYRYYDTNNVPVQYPFGFGLSYTSFEYSNLDVSQNGVSFTITNTGSRDGAKVAQMYVSLPDAKIFRPSKELKGFEKVFLQAGESKEVQIPFDDKTFRYWNVQTNGWEIEEGLYNVMIGENLEDIKLESTLLVKGTTEKIPYIKDEMPTYYSGLIQQVNDEEFEKLLGHEIPDGKWSGQLGMNDAICQMYYAKSRLARLIYKILTRIKNKSEAKGEADLNILFIYNMPFRGIAKMTGGLVNMDMVDGMLTVVNGSFFKGLRKIISGFFANKKANEEYEKMLSGE